MISHVSQMFIFSDCGRPQQEKQQNAEPSSTRLTPMAKEVALTHTIRHKFAIYVSGMAGKIKCAQLNFDLPLHFIVLLTNVDIYSDRALTHGGKRVAGACFNNYRMFI